MNNTKNIKITKRDIFTGAMFVNPYNEKMTLTVKTEIFCDTFDFGFDSIDEAVQKLNGWGFRRITK